MIRLLPALLVSLAFLKGAQGSSKEAQIATFQPRLSHFSSVLTTFFFSAI